MDTKTTIRFGDGDYVAWLPLPQAIELERKCGSMDRNGKVTPKSLFEIYEEIGSGLGIDADGEAVFIGGSTASASHINEVIRCGLIGGDEGPADQAGNTLVGPIRAMELISNYGYPSRPLSEVAATAWKILHAAIVGIDVKKKAEPVKPKPKRPRSTRAKSSPTAEESI